MVDFLDSLVDDHKKDYENLYIEVEHGVPSPAAFDIQQVVQKEEKKVDTLEGFLDSLSVDL